MRITSLHPNLEMITFDPSGKSIINTNVLLIKDGTKTLLIDTGYERHFEMIKNYLSSKKYTLNAVLISHFHNDHIGGLPQVRKLPIHGSIFSKDTLSKYHEKFDDYLPNNPIIGEKLFSFGETKIKIYTNPGHSKCGTIIIIDNTYLFVGDDIIRSESNEAVIPFLADKDILQQIRALTRIKKLAKNKIIIPSHGSILDNNFDIFKDIDNRLTYLDYFRMYPDKTYQEFEQETMIPFQGKAWHKYNTNKA